MLTTEQGPSPETRPLRHATAPAESSKAPADHCCPHTCTSVTQERRLQPLHLVVSHPLPREDFKF